MELRNLRYFVEVADAKSVSRAAERLHRSQPALSRSIRELEEELGLALFERIGRRIALTSNGRSLLESVRLLLRDVEAVAEQARLLSAGKTAVLRVGGSSTIVERVLPEVLRNYRRAWPNVEVVIELGGGTGLLAALESGALDVAITRFVRSAFLDAEPAFPIYALAAVGKTHRLARHRSISIEDLRDERLLVSPSSVTSRMLVELAFRSTGLRPHIALESHEVNVLIALAEADQGIAVVPSTADASGRAVRLLPIVAAGHPLGSWMAAVWNRHRTRPPYLEDFVRRACVRLRSRYPGRQLGLVPPEHPQSE
jgi:DNA-binding transcriptional LysR family regulator